MWFKMGGERIEEAVAEAPPVQVAPESVIVDSSLGGGGSAVSSPSLAEGSPARPVVDAGQMITDVRAASGMDQYIQPEIQSDTSGTKIGETVVLPGQQEPLVSSSDVIKREPMIGAAPDGGIATVSAPADHVDEGVDRANTIKYKPIISTDSYGQLEEDLKVGTPVNEPITVIPNSERKWKGRVPSGALKNNDSKLPQDQPTTVDGAELGTEQSDMQQGLQGTIAAAEQSVADGSAAQPESVVVDKNATGIGGEATAQDGADVEESSGESKDESKDAPDTGTPPDMIGVGVPPPGEKYPNMQPPMPNMWTKPAGEPITDSNPDAGVAIPAPRELTQEEKDAADDRAEDDSMRQKIIQEGLGTGTETADDKGGESGTPPANAGLAAELNSSDNPNAEDRIEPSGVAEANSVLTPAAENELRASGVIAPDSDGTDTIDATAFSTAMADEVVSAAVEEPITTTPEAVDEVVTDAASPAIETKTDDSVVAGAASPTGETADVGLGDAGSDAPETSATDTEDGTGPASVQDGAETTNQVVEDVIKPLEDIMSLNLSDEIDRLSKLDADKRSTEIKILVQKGIRAKLKSEGKENLGDMFDSFEELEKKINAAQMVLEFMVSNSQIDDTQDDTQSAAPAV